MGSDLDGESSKLGLHPCHAPYQPWSPRESTVSSQQQNRDDNTSISALDRLNERLEGRVPGPEQLIRRCVLLPPLERSLL